MTDNITESVARAIDDEFAANRANCDLGSYQIATAAIAAYREAVGSEAVACRWKYKGHRDWLAATLGNRMTYNTDDFDVEPLFAAPPAPILAGYKLVPLEPTEAMLDAYWNRAGESKEMRPRTHHSAKAYYTAMLEAAPTPEATHEND